MKQNDAVFGQIHDRAKVAAALNLAIDDLDPTLPIQTVSTGMAFCIVALRSLEAAERLAIPQAGAREYLESTDAKFFYCITRADRTSGADWHARMQFYNGEDPATGSASGCAIAYLVRHGLAESDQPVVIEQGVEMRRPSRIHVRQVFAREGLKMCSSAAAPFQLQVDVFSCHDARDFNSARCEIPSIHAAFTCTGGCASFNPVAVRPNFAVAKKSNRSYSWQALTTALFPSRNTAGNKVLSPEFYRQLELREGALLAVASPDAPSLPARAMRGSSFSG